MAGPSVEILEDLKRLFALRDRHGATYSKGQIVFSPGDSATHFDVILKGRVQVERSGLEVAVHGPGDLFGEIELFTDQPRAGRATALDDCQTLAFDRESAVALAETAPHFAIIIIQKCCERVLAAEAASTSGHSNAMDEAVRPPATVVSEPSSPVSAPVAAPLGDESTVGPVLSVEYKDAIWKKEFVCPNCRTKFGAWNVRSNFINMESRDTDFMSKYTGVNPNLYAVWVCPSCHMAAYADDFQAIQSVDLPRIRKNLEAVKATDTRAYDFTYFRDTALALRSFQLAVATYEGKRGSDDKVAGLYHRMAWIERERGSVEQERAYMEKAREYYEKAFSNGDSAKQGLLFAYLIAELNLRLGKFNEAVKWFGTASQQPDFKAQPVLEKMTRDRWSEAGILAKDAKVQANA